MLSVLAPALRSDAVILSSYRRNWSEVKPSAAPLSATSATIFTPSSTSVKKSSAASAGGSVKLVE
jgi:hypothetical protein